MVIIKFRLFIFMFILYSCSYFFFLCRAIRLKMPKLIFNLCTKKKTKNYMEEDVGWAPHHRKMCRGYQMIRRLRSFAKPILSTTLGSSLTAPSLVMDWLWELQKTRLCLSVWLFVLRLIMIYVSVCECVHIALKLIVSIRL